jgi:hypothetical protein
MRARLDALRSQARVVSDEIRSLSETPELTPGQTEHWTRLTTQFDRLQVETNQADEEYRSAIIDAARTGSLHSESGTNVGPASISERVSFSLRASSSSPAMTPMD